MHAQRLLNVARALRESRNPEQFTMGRYVNMCGTPGCALGHYAARHDLQDYFRLNQHWLESSRPDPMEIIYGAMDHFEITEKQSDELFSEVGCGNAKTPIQAAEYIEAFVERHRPKTALIPASVMRIFNATPAELRQLLSV
jgi:hypothetical protein